MRVIALDTETFLIGPDAIAPRMVCFSTAELVGEEIVTDLVGNGEDAEARLRALFEDPDVGLVFHNIGFDLAVIAHTYPALEPLIWRMLEDGRCTDTIIREKLLNLSTHGKLDMAPLPDGSTFKIGYKLMDLVLKYLGEDRSALKEGDDIWRLRYNELDGLRADQYPRDAAEYAKGDASDTLRVCLAQEESEGSTETEEFQAMAAFALYLITCQGMMIDPERFYEVQAMLDRELSIENMAPLVEVGIISPPVPALPYSKQVNKARAILTEWLGREPLESEIGEFQPELEGAGIKFKAPEPSKRSDAALRRRVAAILLANATGQEPEFDLSLEELLERLALADVKYKKTDGGALCTDTEVIAEVAALDPVMAVYEHRQELQKLVSTEMPRMTWEGKPARTVHFNYDVLKETGRTSSYGSLSTEKRKALYPSANGQNIDPRVRPVYIPRPGYLLCSTDYSTLELVCVAQVTYDLFGESVHREKINAGYDLHSFLGAQMASYFDAEFRSLLGPATPDQIYEAFVEFKKGDEAQQKFFKHYRKFAKPIGLGFPGGLGPNTVINTAKKSYDVDIIEVAKERYKEVPHEFDRTAGTVLYWAKKLYGWDKDETRWTSRLLGVSLASRLKELWLNTYPEMREYFKMLNSQRSAKRFSEDDEASSDDFTYTTPKGMIRSGCVYTAAANGQVMQSPAAEGFKHAFIDLVRACRDESVGSPLFGKARVLNEIHDETITELWEPEAHELAQEVSRIQVDAMKKVIRDVKVKAEPCLMRRWYKEAEATFDENGRLVPWEPR